MSSDLSLRKSESSGSAPETYSQFSIAKFSRNMKKKYRGFCRDPDTQHTCETQEVIRFDSGSQRISFTYRVEASFSACGSVNVDWVECNHLRIDHNLQRMLNQQDYRQIMESLKKISSKRFFPRNLLDEIAQQLCFLMSEEEFEKLESWE